MVRSESSQHSSQPARDEGHTTFASVFSSHARVGVALFACDTRQVRHKSKDCFSWLLCRAGTDRRRPTKNIDTDQVTRCVCMSLQGCSAHCWVAFTLARQRRTVLLTLQLKACEIHCALDDARSDVPGSLANRLSALAPDVVFASSQADPALLSQIRATFEARTAAAQDDNDAGSDASVYHWPAPSEQAQPDTAEQGDADSAQLQLVATKHFKFVQARPEPAAAQQGAAACSRCPERHCPAALLQM